VLKGKSTGQRIFFNGEWKAGSGQMGNYTVYVNPYIVLKSGGYTKHYYIEGQRIVSKLGGGWNNTGQGSLKAGGNKVDYVGKAQRVFDGIVKNLKFLGADGQILTAGKSGKVPPGQINGTGNIAEAFRYFYHPDHLGSTSYVTDASGEVFQHLEYMAFGETFVEEHSNTDRTPYLFNGKEMDEETGLYYYGARYYDARTSVWVAVDPLAEKYHHISCYAYVANNPLNAIDPNGKEIFLLNAVDIDHTGNYIYKEGQVSAKTMKVLTDIMKTDEGLQYFSQFAKKGQTIAGHTFTEDGKYSSHDLTIQDFSLTEFDGKSNIPIAVEGAHVSRINENDKKVEIYIQIMSFAQDEGEVANTAAHEMQLHGYNGKNLIEAYKKGGKAAYDRERAKDPSGDKDHAALKNKDLKHEGYRRFTNIKNQLIKINKIYIKAFEKQTKE
jgi:RHS repeat-associated protein